MPLFICEDCGCVENTALGRYWTRDTDLWSDDNRGKALCSECSPTEFKSGEKYDRGGKWHGRFPKEKPKVEGLEKGWYINAPSDKESDTTD